MSGPLHVRERFNTTQTISGGGGGYKDLETLDHNAGTICKQPVTDGVEKLDVEVLNEVINKTSRLTTPLILNPSECGLLDIGVWAHYHRRLSTQTIAHRLRYLARMESDAVFRVDLRQPSWDNFSRYMAIMEEVQGETSHTLRHKWKSMCLYLDACGLDRYPYRPPAVPDDNVRVLPFPDTVRRMIYHTYSKDPCKNAFVQYALSLSFMIGWRVPSEPCLMTLDDIIIDDDEYGSVVVTESKKKGRRRSLVPESHILSSRSHKSLKNWVDVWRPRMTSQYSGDALFIWPSSGRPVTPNVFGRVLNNAGKKISPHFRAYDCRHWCATSRLIESYINTGHWDVFGVQHWMGHSKPSTTETYIGHAEGYYHQFSESWIRRALRVLVSPSEPGQLPGSLKKREWGKTLKTLLTFSPVVVVGPGWAHKPLSEKLWGEFSVFSSLSFLGVCQSCLLNWVLSGPYSPFNRTSHLGGGAVC